MFAQERLDQRIMTRFDEMFARGLVAEVQSLLDKYPAGFSRSASQIAGYREVLAHLRGERTLEQIIADVKLHTIQMAKRQRSWVRSLSED